MMGFALELVVLWSLARFVVQVFFVHRPLGGLLQTQREALSGWGCFVC